MIVRNILFYSFGMHGERTRWKGREAKKGGSRERKTERKREGLKMKQNSASPVIITANKKYLTTTYNSELNHRL